MKKKKWVKMAKADAGRLVKTFCRWELASHCAEEVMRNSTGINAQYWERVNEEIQTGNYKKQDK
jgi:hypothetical protein